MDEKRTFQRSETKTEFHAKFKDENKSLTFFIYMDIKYVGGI